jgi:cytochrome c oxidase cbb3-type subunit III
MSDFNAEFWSVYVSGITLLGILSCALLLWIMDNPMPRWWMWLFVITIVFGLLYLAAYPGLGTYKGRLNWTSTGQHATEIAKAEKELAPLYAQFSARKVEDVAGDANAMAIGERLFMNNCSQCHGSDARGSKGFPNLADNDWLHGGTPDKIVETITKGRIGQMPVMAAAVGSPEDVKNVANYVLSLSGSPNDSVRAQLGKEKFVACAACHGVDGKGNQAIGAPNLTDNIWLHGYGEQAIMNMVNNGKTNTMPAQQGKLTDAQIHVVAAYVWGLSNKPQNKP